MRTYKFVVIRCGVGRSVRYDSSFFHNRIIIGIRNQFYLCTADGRPAIYCEDVMEKALAKGNYTLKDLKLPIFHLLQQFCGIYPYMDLTDVRPAAADANLAEIFQVPVGTPLLNMDEVDFDIDGKPVFYSNEYFADGVFKLTVMRKKL